MKTREYMCGPAKKGGRARDAIELQRVQKGTYWQTLLFFMVPIGSRGLQHKASDARWLRPEGCLSLSNGECAILVKETTLILSFELELWLVTDAQPLSLTMPSVMVVAWVAGGWSDDEGVTGYGSMVVARAATDDGEGSDGRRVRVFL
uniref:Uncharacterized protein n=1 Tax=Nelumbo nucifera TaxID=4432 RepID=A0A822YX98_NELNU|nr:TPA_asm: hypothetical protein HUJ06_013016 [Nelumbo nucifera]